ncbi:uncharacterized protein LOC130675457 [Microplitis mediator]|uniref:uncharacterized protein LOC130675457 n=1 Tax=Microplitis mediator TaxID=375433 RepID=UPI0025537EF6|nr:uncharacterized protein LOC130675457 [Microplitis mediator]
MVSILQLLLFGALLSISEHVYCLDDSMNAQLISSIAPLLNSIAQLSDKNSIDNNGRRFFEDGEFDLNDYGMQLFPQSAADADDFNSQYNVNINKNLNGNLPWTQPKMKNKFLKKSREDRWRDRKFKELKRNQDLRDMMQKIVPRNFDQSGRRNGARKCHDSSEEEFPPADDCNCSIGGKLLRQIRFLKYQIDVLEKEVLENYNTDEDTS